MERLNSHQRDTLAALFAHPTSHNIHWVDVISLLEAVGTVEDKRDGGHRVTVGQMTEVFEEHGKDIPMEAVIDLRRMLIAAGLAPEGAVRPDEAASVTAEEASA